MTREEAINLLADMDSDKYTAKEAVALSIAIEALEHPERNVVEVVPCGDTISRQAVQDYIAKYLSQYLYNDVREAVEVIDEYIGELPSVTPQPKTGWIPVSERLPELNRPLLVTTYHRVYYGHLISESGNYGYPVFRIHGLGDKNRDWVQETMSHEPYSLGRIDAWMYLDIPEPYKVEPQESEE